MTNTYIPCGGCGAKEPRERCIGCLHDFGAPSRINHHRPKYGYYSAANMYLLATNNNKNYLPRFAGESPITADQAREAAHLLNQLAEYLECQTKQP